jgi:hypothetical protein
MAFTMKIDMKEIDSWIKNQPNRDRAKKQTLTVIKNELVGEIKGEMAEHTTTGELEGSVMGVVGNDKLEIFSNMYGDIVLEYGRRPGKFPPVEALESWALQHGMSKGAGYVIARNIARRGTKKYREKAPKQLTAIQERLNRDILPTKLVTLLNEFTK